VQIDSEQLGRHLQRGLAPLYVVHGEETLLALEAADRIRAEARRQGYGERELMIAERGFEWGRLLASGASLSLFAARRLIELHVAGAAAAGDGAKVLAEYASALPPDTLTLVMLPAIESRTRSKAEWFTALEKAGVAVHAQPVAPAALPAWLAGRLAAQGHTADDETIALLAARVEGNLLAAHQEVQKLALLHPPGPLTREQVGGAVLDVARYDVSALREALLAGDVAHAARVLDGLQAEGEGLPLVVWAVAEEARGMLAVDELCARGLPMAKAFEQARVWRDRQAKIQRALRRMDRGALRAALGACARIDRIAKGVAQGDAWDELRAVAVLFGGTARGRPGTEAR
jgi:DNA polymerase-3 subunit delta